ncbi:hypothetical protein BD414DRAFT_523443 [Trametes punicea]|nr:hypothetical protein BD414DRAFT_523443 [Trametes punicea]
MSARQRVSVTVSCEVPLAVLVTVPLRWLSPVAIHHIWILEIQLLACRVTTCMAARSSIGRIARLTLFSGPNCSLCDIAKAELAKVRQQRAFELETINIQDPGQERWKRKYVYWIPALHLEGREVAKGRWDAQTVNQALDTWERIPWTKEDYGEEESAHVRRCFNCGSPDHVLSACPEPIDRNLVSLSRQLFSFYHGESSGPFRRFHEVERWRQQRLQWLDEFEPGQIKGTLLREALGLGDGDPGERVEWLRNMASWGYPPGWVGTRDPRERVWQLIAEDAVSDSDEAFEFTIVGDEGEERLAVPQRVTNHDVEACSEEDDDSPEASATSRRWATYPDTYFLWSKLPVYKGSSLPAVGLSISPSQSPPTSITEPPVAPEPTDSPPPLPPSEPPPLPSSPEVPSLLPSASTLLPSDGEDMDLSD